MRPQFTRIDPARLRTGFGVKWGSLAGDTIGAWVADMDFGIPPAVRDRMSETVEREDFGYPFWTRVSANRHRRPISPGSI